MSQTGRATHLTFRSVLGAFIVAERKEQGAASDLFRLAKKAGNLAAFEDACDEAEKFYQSDAAGQMQVHELPRKWVQAKSDIRGAFRAGLDLNRIPSYHKMKKLKAKANRGEQEHVPSAEPQQSTTPQPVEEEDGTITLTPISAGQSQPEVVAQERRPRQVSTRDKRERRPQVTVEEALENGDVLDARTNMIIPEDMVELCRLLSKTDDVSRARFIKRFTKDVRDALSRQGQVRQHQQTARRA